MRSRPPIHFGVPFYLLPSAPGYAAALLRSAIRYPARVVVVRGSYVRRRGAHDIIVRRGADLLRTDKPMLANAAMGRIQVHGARYPTLKVSFRPDLRSYRRCSSEDHSFIYYGV